MGEIRQREWQKAGNRQYPVVRIRSDELKAIVKYRKTFKLVIADVRRIMTERGLNYNAPFFSWFDTNGDLLHQNTAASYPNCKATSGVIGAAA